MARRKPRKNLRRKRPKSSKIRRMNRLDGRHRQQNLVGVRFGRLIILSLASTGGHAKPYRWNFRCDCGVERSVSQRELVNGDTNSCGCLKKGLAGVHNVKTVREKQVFYIYKVTPAQHKQLLESQEFKCANTKCGAAVDLTSPIDHDHSCCKGKASCGRCIRGILCGNCNFGMGSFRDSPNLLRGAIEYLEGFSESATIRKS